MKLTVQKKGICFFIILTMIVSGMCFEFIRTDACFLYSNTANESTLFYTGKSLGTEQQAFLDLQLDRTEVCRVSGREDDWREVRVRNAGGSACMMTALMAEDQLSACREAVHYIVPKNLASTAIIAYVHHQDGSKD